MGWGNILDGLQDIDNNWNKYEVQARLYPIFFSCPSISYSLVIKPNQSCSLNISLIHPLTIIRLQVHWSGHLSSPYCTARVPPHSSISPLFNIPIYTAVREVRHTINFTIFLICSKFFTCSPFLWRVSFISLRTACTSLYDLDLIIYPNGPSSFKLCNCVFLIHVASFVCNMSS